MQKRPSYAWPKDGLNLCRSLLRPMYLREHFNTPTEVAVVSSVAIAFVLIECVKVKRLPKSAKNGPHVGRRRGHFPSPFRSSRHIQRFTSIYCWSVGRFLRELERSFSQQAVLLGVIGASWFMSKMSAFAFNTRQRFVLCIDGVTSFADSFRRRRLGRYRSQNKQVDTQLPA